VPPHAPYTTVQFLISFCIFWEPLPSSWNIRTM